jgi:hypothetical protein
MLDKGLTATLGPAARLEMSTTGPGVQPYTANGIAGTILGRSGHLHRSGDGVALEPEIYGCPQPAGVRVHPRRSWQILSSPDDLPPHCRAVIRPRRTITFSTIP